MVSTAKKEANKRYDDKNREMKRYSIAKSTAFRFARGYGKKEDLEQLIGEAKKTLEKD